MGAKASDVRAGGAAVVINADDTPFIAGLSRAESRMKAFGAAVTAIGSKVSLFGIGLGAGLLASVKSFASIGTELATVNQQLLTVDKTSEQFKSLTKESERLSKIMGGSDVAAAVKLSQSFVNLSDSIKSVVVTFGASLAPVLINVVDYVTTAVKSVGNFIKQNKGLASQAAVVVTALTAAGVATAALGSLFFVTGPLIRVAMIAASVASLGFAAAMGIVNTVVGVSSAVVKVLSTVVWLSAAAWQALRVTTVSFAVVGAAANIVAKSLAFTFGAIYAVTKAVTLSIAIMTATAGLAAMGYKSLATAITVARTAMLGYSVASAAASLFSFSALIVGGVALAAAFLLWTDAGKSFVSAIGSGLSYLKSLAVDAFAAITGAGAGMPGQLSGYFADVATMARAMFGEVWAIGQATITKTIGVFKDLLATGQATFQGISDAIGAGDIQLAMDVLWAGLKVSWTQGTDGLKSLWNSSMIVIEGALDIAGSSLKTIWEVTLGYLEGAFDKFVLYIRHAMQNVSGYIAETLASIDPTGMIFGDLESAQEENKAQQAAIENGAKKREDDRNNRIANAGDDAGARARAADRQSRLDAQGGPSAELAKQKAELAALVAQAKKATPLAINATAGAAISAEVNRAGSSVKAAEAQARGSSGVASSIAKAVSQSGGDPQLLETKKSNAMLTKMEKYLDKLSNQKPINVTKVS